MKTTILYLLCILQLVLLSCKQNTGESPTPTIDYQKIDMLFEQETSDILFNHLYITLDSISYSQFLKASQWMESYAAIDEGLPNFHPITENTTTSYLRGHHHYVEILGPDNAYGAAKGKSGIGFCLTHHKESFNDSIAPKLKKEDTPYLAFSETIVQPLAATEDVWFKAFYTKGPKTNMQSWYAFYNPEFLTSLHGSEHENYARDLFLKKTYAPEKLFKGISSIELACNQADYNRIAQEMRHLGCPLLKKVGDTLTVRSGDIDIKLMLHPEQEQSHIHKLLCTLNRADESVKAFGDLVIINSGHQSVWTFANTYE
ncbi:DUF5829 family protein [Maribacter antarcticus]|uniref:DUF5829 family protein n=1 Tax=Maribacter antarcticus TaxID=505250 RepID=UPI0012EC4D24|nr:DUF5829 family protein [Maribacter antarcticus]